MPANPGNPATPSGFGAGLASVLSSLNATLSRLAGMPRAAGNALPQAIPLAGGGPGASAAIPVAKVMTANQTAAKLYRQAAQDAAKEAQRLAASQHAVAIGFAAASAATAGWIRYGLSGTTLGERFGYTTNQLARQLTSLFVPAIEAVITKIQSVTNWFRELSGAQQQQLARWAGLAAGVGLYLTLLPRITSALSAVGLANPFAALVVGVAALMARSETGRESLATFADAALSAFGKLAEVLGAVLIPVLDALTAALDGPLGKAVLLGAVFVTAAFKIVGALRSIAAALATTGGAIGLGIGAAIGIVLALATAFKSSTAEFVKGNEDIIASVRKGQMTVEEAKRQIAIRAAVQAEAEQEQRGAKDLGFAAPPMLEELANTYRQMRTAELEKAGTDRLDRALERLAGAGKDRSDVVTARTGTEDARATFRRLEDAILRADVGKQQLDEAKETNEWLKKAVDALIGGALGGMKKDGREKPEKVG